MGAKKRTKFLMYTDKVELTGLTDEVAGMMFKYILAKTNNKEIHNAYPNVLDDILESVEFESDLQQVKVVKKRKKKSIATEPLHAKVKQCFLDYYELEKKFVYSWAPKDAFSLNQFITKCRNLCVSEKQTNNLADILIETIKENSPWVFERLSVALLNSMFNDIFDACKNGKKKQKSNISFEESMDISEQNYEEKM